ncbi:flavin reductase family protein [Sciscionella sediminilitoris]|uniref:flavin reductase family protein n=1 Tax=Sciscionella sediminilitoris TaxID=1445613 RepID=UPI0004DEF617|nr:flavin reductase family protein [Sciscionella sp. SE31]
MFGTSPVGAARVRQDHAAPEAGFRELMSSFPTGVSIVTAIAGDSRPHGLTCTSLTSVTMRPPTMLVCLNTGSGTLGALLETGRFAVNLLDVRGQRAAEVFSSAHQNRFAAVAWQPAPVLGVPWLTEDAFALAECQVSEVTEVGDHAAVFAEVAAVRHHAGQVLLYGERRFAAWR